MSWFKKIFGGAGSQSRNVAAPPRERQDPDLGVGRWAGIEEKLRSQVQGLVSRRLLDAIYGRRTEISADDAELHQQSAINRLYADTLFDMMKTGVAPPIELDKAIQGWVEAALREWAEADQGDDGALAEQKTILVESLLKAFRRAAADESLKKAAAARVETDAGIQPRG